MNTVDSTLETIEMSEIDGLEQGAVLLYISVPKRNAAHDMLELSTCIGDLYVIVNALYDYAKSLEQTASEQGLDSYRKELFLLHAERCRKIAGKFSQQMGYDYEKALERCWKRRAKESNNDTGMDSLEALLQKQKCKKGRKEIKDKR